MNITIRKAVDKDYPVIIDVLKEFAVFQKMPDGTVTNTAELMKEEEDFFECFVAENDNGDFVGMASFFFAYYTWSGKSLYLEDLYVREQFRKKKVGKLLLDKVFETARATNCKRVRWLVSHWNQPAIDFYIQCGASIHKEEFVCEVDREGIDNYIHNIGK